MTSRALRIALQVRCRYRRNRCLKVVLTCQKKTFRSHAGRGNVDPSEGGGAYVYHAYAGWCSSELDQEPLALADTWMDFFSLDTCWNACVDEFAWKIHNVQYDCDEDSCYCFCQSSCDCMEDVGWAGTAFRAGESGALHECSYEGEDTDAGSGTYIYEKGVGWCNSDLDQEPSALSDQSWFSLDTCWNSCVDEFGMAVIHNVQYDCWEDTCWCYCQDSCPCVEDVGEDSTARWVGSEALPTPTDGGFCLMGEDTEEDDEFVYAKGVGWCSSDLDEVPPSLPDPEGFFTSGECLAACQADFPDTFHNAEYDCDPWGCRCYCQSSSCTCMADEGYASTLYDPSDPIQLPRSCTSAYATGDDASFVFEKGAGWCITDLNQEPPSLADPGGHYSADDCWNACKTDFSATLNHAEYDCNEESCWCYCQDAPCTCMEKGGLPDSIIRFAADTEPLAGACGQDYFCHCKDLDADEAACEAKLGDSSFLVKTLCGEYTSWLSGYTSADCPSNPFGYGGFGDQNYISACCVEDGLDSCHGLKPDFHATKAVFASGEQVEIAFSFSQSVVDWLEVYPYWYETSDHLVDWKHTSNTKFWADSAIESGTLTFDLPDGKYAAWYTNYDSSNNFIAWHGQTIFTVGTIPTLTTLSTDKETFAHGSSVEVSFSNSGLATGHDWIAIVPKGTRPLAKTWKYVPSIDNIAWMYATNDQVGGKLSVAGNVTFSNIEALAVGAYDVYYLQNDSDEVIAGPLEIYICPLGGCGTCYSSSSTVTRLLASATEDQEVAKQVVPITSLKIGDMVLSASHAGVEAFDQVLALPRSPSTTPFVELVVQNSGSSTPTNLLRVTPHHTVAVCSRYEGAIKEAAAILAGDCVKTEKGKARVVSAKIIEAAVGEETFTVVLKGKANLLSVDGVFTHAKAEIPVHTKKVVSAKPANKDARLHVPDAEFKASGRDGRAGHSNAPPTPLDFSTGKGK